LWSKTFRTKLILYFLILKKMPPKRTTTNMTDVAVKALIGQGVATVLDEYKANRSSGNGDDSHDSRSGRRTERVTQLALMCGRMFPEESDEVEKYVRGLPDMIQGSVMASKQKTMQDAIEIANDLMGKKIRTFAERHAENKRKLNNNNQAQQQSLKKQNVARAYFVVSSEKKEYAGTLPLCNKCKFRHNGPCTVKCANCNRVGHLTRDYRSPATTNNQRTPTCYEYRDQGHYMSDFSELKNRNHRNQAGGTEARGMVYALGRGETDQDLNNIEDDINA
nr:hypothetical protein [Tanacetum cinerariifolium]